jgi:hypothetical protein
MLGRHSLGGQLHVRDAADVTESNIAATGTHRRLREKAKRNHSPMTLQIPSEAWNAGSQEPGPLPREGPPGSEKVAC